MRRKVPSAYLPWGPSPAARQSCWRLPVLGAAAAEPGASCLSPPGPVTRPPHRSSPAGSTGSQGRKQSSPGRQRPRARDEAFCLCPRPASPPCGAGGDACPRRRLCAPAEDRIRSLLSPRGARGTGIPPQQRPHRHQDCGVIPGQDGEALGTRCCRPKASAAPKEPRGDSDQPCPAPA